jgi:hypothetical protein
MRTSHAAIALAAVTAGLTVAATLRRLAGLRLPLEPAVGTTTLPSVAPNRNYDTVVLPFARPVAGPAPQLLLESPARCRDSGGQTKAGAPCGARTTPGSRCHHHPMAA